MVAVVRMFAHRAELYTSMSLLVFDLGLPLPDLLKVSHGVGLPLPVPTRQPGQAATPTCVHTAACYQPQVDCNAPVHNYLHSLGGFMPIFLFNVFLTWHSLGGFIPIKKTFFLLPGTHSARLIHCPACVRA